MEYLIRLPHGYFRGGISDLPELSPTIDAHIACWHVLIGEIDEMADMACKQVATLTGGKWDKCLESNRRVYSTENISPTITTCGGGNTEVKILDQPIAYDEQNDILRPDGTVGTITTDGSSPKHNNRVVEPNARVRKLTERECFKLQGVKPKDFEKVAKNQSKSSCYHLAGDSICSSVLMAIFGELLGIDWRSKVDETVEEIIK